MQTVLISRWANTHVFVYKSVITYIWSRKSFDSVRSCKERFKFYAWQQLLNGQILRSAYIYNKVLPKTTI